MKNTHTPSESQAEKSPLTKHLDILYKQRYEATYNAILWKRIATRLYEAMTDPEMTDWDKEYAIETYLNYINPEDEE